MSHRVSFTCTCGRVLHTYLCTCTQTRDIVKVESQHCTAECSPCPPAAEAGMSTPQPAPKATLAVPTWELVIKDMRERDQTGRAKYGVPLQHDNGRDHLVDAYQEALDLAVYLRAEIARRES